MSWMNFNEYVLMEHMVSDRLDELRRAAEWHQVEAARPTSRARPQILALWGWSRGETRCFGDALLRALGVVSLLVAAATAVLVLLPAGRSGRVVDHRVAWLGSELPPWTRTYYKLRAPGEGATYRVSVFAFDWLRTASIQAP